MGIRITLKRVTPEMNNAGPDHGRRSPLPWCCSVHPDFLVLLFCLSKFPGSVLAPPILISVHQTCPVCCWESYVYPIMLFTWATESSSNGGKYVLQSTDIQVWTPEVHKTIDYWRNSSSSSATYTKRPGVVITSWMMVSSVYTLSVKEGANIQRFVLFIYFYSRIKC